MSESRYKLILADGTELDGGHAGYADGFLWCWFTGKTIQEAAEIFFDTSKTSVIIFAYSGATDTYNGFTVCRVLSINDEGEIAVCMTKEK